MCQKSVAVRYWYGTWRHGANHQAVECKTVAVATVSARRLAAGMCPPGGDREFRILLCQRRLAVGVSPLGSFLPVSA